MSATIKLGNFEEGNKLEVAMFDADAAAAATLVVVKGNQAFAQNLYALLGQPGNENTELRLISAISGSNLTVPALTRPHKKYDTVTLLAANQLQVWRGAAPSDGSPPEYSAMAKYGSPINIDYDNLTTRYTDPDGSSDYWYGYTYFNSTTSAETEIEASELVRGGSVSDYCSIEDIREESNTTNNPWISDVFIASRRTMAEGVIDDALGGIHTVPFTDPIPRTIKLIAILLAAGLVMKKEFGSGVNGTTSNGTAKYKEGMAMLQKIVDGSSPITNPGGTGAVNRPRVSGWPNSTTETTSLEDGGSKRKIRAGMKF